MLNKNFINKKQQVISEKETDRKKEFKNRLDNSQWYTNELTEYEHEELYNLLEKLVSLDIQSEEAKLLILSVEMEFISKFSYHRPVDYYFKQWNKTSFLSDSFHSLIVALEDDIEFISNNTHNYANLYGK